MQAFFLLPILPNVSYSGSTPLQSCCVSRSGVRDTGALETEKPFPGPYLDLFWPYVLEQVETEHQVPQSGHV